MKKVISTEKAPAAIGPYSQGFEVNGMVYLSGQIPVNPADGSVGEGIEAQAEQSCFLDEPIHVLLGQEICRRRCRRKRCRGTFYHW